MPEAKKRVRIAGPSSVRAAIKLIDGRHYISVTPGLLKKAKLAVGPCYVTETGGVLQVTPSKSELAIPVLLEGQFGFHGSNSDE